MLDQITSAANNYKRVAQIIAPLAPQNAVPVQPSEGTQGGFGAMVSGFVDSVGAAGKTADSQTALAVKGKGDLVDMVTAIAESEVALETLVSMRDKAITAYEEIMRMPI